MPIAAPLAIGALGAAGSIGSAFIGAGAARDAADKQYQAAQQALAFQQQAYAENKANYQPYLDIGRSASSSLADLYGLGPQGAAGVNKGWENFTNLPAYQFPMQQGMLALTRNLNAQGLNASGAQMKEAQQYGQGLASQYMMSNYVSPLQNFMSLGANAASNLGANTANMSSTIGNTMQAGGAAQASGIVGSANAIMGGINNAVGYANYGLGAGRSNPYMGMNNAYSTSSYGAPSFASGATNLPTGNAGPWTNPGGVWG